MGRTCGLDVLGAEEAPARSLTVEEKLNKAYFRISVKDAAGLLDKAYVIFVQARDKARDGFFEKNLGAEKTITNQMIALSAFSNELKKDKDQGRPVTRDEWEKTRNFVRAARSQLSGVAAGRAAQDQIFDDFLNEVKEGLSDLPLKIPGLIPWQWWLAGGVVLMGGAALYFGPALAELARAKIKSKADGYSR